ncbi:GDSL-type esterase/lipase family protein [Sediminibacterium ginsengisoli]|uniref:Lysophospholipase L1 n=1 Tax=Sediminibacterium ginsengisoli TaxID=413434 RepID=A0A1T4P6D5_9BACT|nr:GDSL-type esterase/lipase family protein [Sediminibacterium ginsengisoli]SJZ86961.1 Lysophospholipase L1 [Sediminibacterium ginsengisoli]
MRLLCFFLSILIYLPVSRAAEKLRITCIGASITAGARTADPSSDAFPAQLQQKLGHQYIISNYGVSGTTMLKKGDKPYQLTTAFESALKSEPDIVLIDLGGNDSKAVNRPFLSELESDSREMISRFAALPSHPRIILLLPVVSFRTDTSGIWDPVIVKAIIPRLQQAAWKERTEVIDMHQLLVNRPELFADGIHPGTEGSHIMAERLYDVIVQKTAPGFDLFRKIDTGKKISSFYGYDCAEFTIDGRNCKVVKPKQAAPGKPWIWRARFWGHEPQTDIALLERGYHVVYCDVIELFGNSEAIGYWNRFYALLQKAGLAKKAVMEGMSRGAVYALNWAAENPGKVAAVYIDNPVLDLKSWPAGKGKFKAWPKEYALFRTDYNLQTEEEVDHFHGSPIDKIRQLVKGKFPILILCADADEAVAPEENTLPFAEKMKAAGADVTVLHKPGFKHHPHSLPNPEPIVNFILNHNRH